MAEPAAIAMFEPEIEEVMGDPIIRLMMESDHVAAEAMGFVPAHLFDQLARPAGNQP